jgi:hypothetical protein
MKMIFSIGLAVMLTGCAGHSPMEGPLVDMAGVDQNRYNTDLSECRNQKQNSSFVGAATMISDCMASRGYHVIEKRG